MSTKGGTVKFFNTRKGFGFIEGEDSKDVSAKTELSYKQNEKKRRKLGEGKRNERGISNAASAAYNSVRGLYQKYNSLFEWVDGPLVTSMRSGNLLLLDEMSLAEDAVLERLNSVLEPSRTLTLAEKGGDDEPAVSYTHLTLPTILLV